MDLRIALVAPETLPLPPKRGGAVQIYIDAIIPFLAKHHSITLFSPQSGNEQSSYGSNINHIRLPKEDYLQHVGNLLQLLEYDIVHIFNRPDYVHPLYQQTPFSWFILNLHNDPETRVEKKLYGDEKHLWCDKVDRVIANSYYTKSVTLKKFPSLKGKVQTVHLGVDTSKFYPPKQSRTRQKKTILFIGRLNRSKGLHILIQAAAKLKTKHPGILLLVVGGSEHGSNRQTRYTRYILQLAKKKLGKNIRFTGFLAPNKIPQTYRHSDIFVCPSTWEEPFGRVNLEAMASGLPVVTSRKGGIPEAVLHGKTGFLVKRSHRSSDYAEKIGKLLSDRHLCHRMGRAGRQRVKQKFTWSQVARKLAKIYEGVSTD